jgi:hypothetical protein
MTETKRAGLTPVSNSTTQVYIGVILYEDVGVICYGIFESSYTYPFYLVIATSYVSTYGLFMQEWRTHHCILYIMIF